MNNHNDGAINFTIAISNVYILSHYVICCISVNIAHRYPCTY